MLDKRSAAAVRAAKTIFQLGLMKAGLICNAPTDQLVLKLGQVRHLVPPFVRYNSFVLYKYNSFVLHYKTKSNNRIKNKF